MKARLYSKEGTVREFELDSDGIKYLIREENGRLGFYENSDLAVLDSQPLLIPLEDIEDIKVRESGDLLTLEIRYNNDRELAYTGKGDSDRLRAFRHFLLPYIGRKN